MFILQNLPKGVPTPEPFVQGSRALLEEVTTKMVESYHSDVGYDIAEEWIKFRDNTAPQSDSVSDHIKKHSEHFHIPLRDELFEGSPCEHGDHINGRARKKRSSMDTVASRDRESQQLDYVRWSRRGKALDKKDPAKHLPNQVIRGPPGVKFSVPVYCRQKGKTANNTKEKPKSPVKTVVVSSEGEYRRHIIASHHNHYILYCVCHI